MIEKKINFVAFVLSLTVCGSAPSAVAAMTTSGKLLLTGGVSQIEGSAGGGLTPWAVIGGYGTKDQVGANAFYTQAATQAYTLESEGFMVGLFDRVELSYSRQIFNTRDLGPALKLLPQDFRIKQSTIGVKVRVIGDAVLDQDTWMPAIAVGVQAKHNEQGDVVALLGSQSDSGTDFYVSATKIFLAQSLLANVTVRETKANQLGILGFGGNAKNAYQPMLEASLAYLLCPNVAVGGEYRMKPDNLTGIKEDPWEDLFIAWAPTKNISLTGAYVNLSTVATRESQSGTYASLQVGF